MTSPVWADPRGLAQRLMESAPLVAIYESRLWRRSRLFALLTGISFERELEAIAALGRIDRASRVLDLACGSGIYARPFARSAGAGRVAGLDLSRPMLRYAARRSRAEGLANLDLVRGTALALPFRSEVFENVNCCGALHLFPDVPKALREIHRVLRPGGRLTAAVIRRGEGARARRAAERRLRLLGVHSFSRDELEGLLADAGFRDASVPHERGVWMLAGAAKPGSP
jgi:SAM-dependent methyltransferase